MNQVLLQPVKDSTVVSQCFRVTVEDQPKLGMLGVLMVFLVDTGTFLFCSDFSVVELFLFLRDSAYVYGRTSED